ncbi:MAG: ABC transporter permease [Dorea sp.]|jgi:peptide/nickel transport system permease protein|nr:ABC transporter permease [Dorea sp.]
MTDNLNLSKEILAEYFGDNEQDFKKRNQVGEVWRRMRKNKTAMLGLAVIIIFALLAIFADFICSYDTMAIKQNVSIRLQTSSSEHWFGTDTYGRDVFARVIHGGRISLSVGFVSVAISSLFGGLLGAAAGLYGGKVDNMIMRFMDAVVSIPSMLLTLALVAALGHGIRNLLIAITIGQIPAFTRVVRASVLSVAGQDFIESARSYGTGTFRIIYRHIIPNAIGPIIVQATMSIAGTILQISGLSFLGMGIEAPAPEWGSMLAEARPIMRSSPHLVVFPGMAIVLATLAMNLIGDGLRDALDPKLKD